MKFISKVNFQLNLRNK